jgi:hypothetical protein
MKFAKVTAVAMLATAALIVKPSTSQASPWGRGLTFPVPTVLKLTPAEAESRTDESELQSQAPRPESEASAQVSVAVTGRLKLPKISFVPQASEGQVPRPGAVPPALQVDSPERAGFMRVLRYSLQLIFYEHVMRVAVQPFTRAELDGPFWRDYIKSVKMPKQWGDGDSWEVNYIGHSMHGSAGVRLWLDQREQDYQGNGKAHYWKAMGRAFLFGTLFSLQFEIGPLSEASIGNVGLREGRTGWVDHVVTPIGSVVWTMYEDAVDKYVLTWIEKHVPFNMAKVAARMILCPAWMLANVGQNRLPWARANRPLTFVK